MFSASSISLALYYSGMTKSWTSSSLALPLLRVASCPTSRLFYFPRRVLVPRKRLEPVQLTKYMYRPEPFLLLPLVDSLSTWLNFYSVHISRLLAEFLSHLGKWIKLIKFGVDHRRFYTWNVKLQNTTMSPSLSRLPLQMNRFLLPSSSPPTSHFYSTFT